MGVRRYWRSVVGLALAESWQWGVGHPIGAMLTAATTMFGAAALWWLGSADGFRDHLIYTGVAIATLSIVLAVLFVWHLLAIPPRWHGEQLKQFASLRDEATRSNMAANPALRFDLDPSSQQHSELIVERPGRERLVGRVAVRNVSPDRSIQDVTVRVVEYVKLGGHAPVKTSILLKSGSVNGTHATVHASELEYFNLIRAKPAGHGPLILAPGREGEARQLEGGEYRFSLIAAGKDVAPVTANYYVRVEGRQIFIVDDSG